VAIESILRFGLARIKQAQRIVEGVREKAAEARAEARKTVTSIEEVARRVKAVQNRGGAVNLNDILQRQSSVGELSRRANAQRFAEKGLAAFGAVRQFAAGIQTDSVASNLFTAATFAGSFVGGPAAIVVQAASVAVGIIKPLIDKEIQRERRILAEEIDARFNAAVRQLDIEARLREDPDFAAEQARRFGVELRAQEAAIQRAREAELQGKPFNQRTLRPRGGLGQF